MNAIYATGAGRCERHDPNELGALWRAMTGGGEGRGPRGGAGRGHGRHGGHRERGYGAWGGYGFPFGGPGGGGPFGRGRGRQGRRGGHERRGGGGGRGAGAGARRPGSVYPALAQLEDEGLIRSEEIDGRKLFRLTDAGEAQLKDRPEDAPAPWEQMSDDLSDQAFELGKLIKELVFAFGQVMRTGSEAQIGEARKVLATARRELYRILGDGDPESTNVEGDA